jgi:hypothetical protein
MPEEQFETPVYNPLMHSLHTSATMHDDPDSLAGLNAIEKDPSAKVEKGTDPLDNLPCSWYRSVQGDRRGRIA